MEECPQCYKKLETPTVRLVQDSCGHQKCRVCLLEDEILCKQCNNIKEESLESKLLVSHFTPVITFKVKKETEGENKCKQKSNKANRKTDEDILKRTYQSVVIPSYISVNASSPTYKCQLCSKTFNTKSHIKYHRYCNGDKKPFRCNVCSKEFVTKNHLETHMVIHTGARKHSCNICRKTFVDNSKLVRHQALHSDEKPYVCQECDKKFKSKESLKLHISIHKGDKPFKCLKCNASFNNSSNLKKHEVTHSKEKVHMCDQCGKRFKLKWDLTVHSRVHLHLKPYECTSCGKAFKNTKDLHRHKLIHSDVKGYSCSICRIEFRRKDNLIRHMKNSHPGIKLPSIKNSEIAQNLKPNQNGDTPNAINVITTLSEQPKILPEQKVPLINAPLKLAFKTSAFKNNYNIHRNYEPPNEDSDASINIYQKILQPHSPNSSTASSQQELDKISDDMINQYKNKPINYETSFMQTPHAIIKNIKFKLPDNYTNIKSNKEFLELKPLTPVTNVNIDNEHDTGDVEYTELKPAKTSVIVNNSSDVHWRRRTLQSLNVQQNKLQEAV